MSSTAEPLPTVPCCKIQVRKGFTLMNLFTFFYASMVNIIALAFINAALPYLLSNFLHIKDNEGSKDSSLLTNRKCDWNSSDVE